MLKEALSEKASGDDFLVKAASFRQGKVAYSNGLVQETALRFNSQQFHFRGKRSTVLLRYLTEPGN